MSDQQATENTTIDLTFQDLYNIRELINVAAQRGAYRAPEFQSVGAVYDRLNAVVVALSPQPPESEETQDQQAPESE